MTLTGNTSCNHVIIVILTSIVNISFYLQRKAALDYGTSKRYITADQSSLFIYCESCKQMYSL